MYQQNATMIKVKNTKDLMKERVMCLILDLNSSLI